MKQDTRTASTARAAMTADECEAILRAALSAGDMEGVAAALRVMAAIDPRRALAIHDQLRTALAVANVIRPLP